MDLAKKVQKQLQGLQDALDKKVADNYGVKVMKTKIEVKKSNGNKEAKVAKKTEKKTEKASKKAEPKQEEYVNAKGETKDLPEVEEAPRAKLLSVLKDLGWDVSDEAGLIKAAEKSGAGPKGLKKLTDAALRGLVDAELRLSSPAALAAAAKDPSDCFGNPECYEPDGTDCQKCRLLARCAKWLKSAAGKKTVKAVKEEIDAEEAAKEVSPEEYRKALKASAKAAQKAVSKAPEGKSIVRNRTKVVWDPTAEIEYGPDAPWQDEGEDESFKEMGSLIWKEKPPKMSNLLVLFLANYDVTKEAGKEAVLDLLNSLQESGFVKVVD